MDTSLKLMNKKEELLKVEQEIGKLEGDTQITDINQLERDYRRLEKEKREIDMQVCRNLKSKSPFEITKFAQCHLSNSAMEYC